MPEGALLAMGQHTAASSLCAIHLPLKVLADARFYESFSMWSTLLNDTQPLSTFSSCVIRGAEALCLQGPHVMEVSVKGAQLSYPLTTIRSFCHDLVETYSHYVYPPWVDPYPQVKSVWAANSAFQHQRQPHVELSEMPAILCQGLLRRQHLPSWVQSWSELANLLSCQARNIAQNGCPPLMGTSHV